MTNTIFKKTIPKRIPQMPYFPKKTSRSSVETNSCIKPYEIPTEDLPVSYTHLNRKLVRRNERILISVTSLCVVIVFTMLAAQVLGANSKEEEKKYIKWVDFDVCYSALQKALDEDIATHNSKDPISWTETLAYLGAKYGGDFSRYRSKDMDAYFEKRKSGQTQEAITEDMEYYPYYYAVSYTHLSFDGKWRCEQLLLGRRFHLLPGTQKTSG